MTNSTKLLVADLVSVAWANCSEANAEILKRLN